MHFWNKDNFDDLLGLAEQLDSDPQLSVFAEYCRLRERGLRSQAMQAARQASVAAAELPADLAREAASRLLEIATQRSEAHQFLSHPIKECFLKPVLRNWAREQPQAATPNRWLGYLLHDGKYFAKALAADPGDDFSRAKLVNFALGDVEHAVHHLGESLFLGSVTGARTSLQEAAGLIQDFSDEDLRAHYGREHDELQQMLDDWQAFKASRDTDFVAWSRRQGRSYGFPSTVYYGSAKGSRQ